MSVHVRVGPRNARKRFQGFSGSDRRGKVERVSGSPERRCVSRRERGARRCSSRCDPTLVRDHGGRGSSRRRNGQSSSLQSGCARQPRPSELQNQRESLARAAAVVRAVPEPTVEEDAVAVGHLRLHELRVRRPIAGELEEHARRRIFAPDPVSGTRLLHDVPERCDARISWSDESREVCSRPIQTETNPPVGADDSMSECQGCTSPLSPNGRDAPEHDSSPNRSATRSDALSRNSKR